jgi:hypothetical protein
VLKNAKVNLIFNTLGVKKSALKEINHLDLVKCNIEGGSLDVTQETFRTKKHNLFSAELTVDNVITRYDTKRMLDSRIFPLIYTVPLGYKSQI